MYIDLLEKFVIYVHVHIRFHFFRKYCTLTVKVNKGNMLAVLYEKKQHINYMLAYSKGVH